MILVDGSLRRYSKSSVSSTSHLFPMENILAKLRVLLVMRVVMKPAERRPLWTMREIWPGFITPFKLSVVINEKTYCLEVLINPIQLGPQIRIPPLRAMERHWFCNAFPSGLTSAKPLDSIITPLTPLMTQSSKTWGTAWAGTKINAISKGPLISKTLGKHLRPRTSPYLGLTG